MNIIRKENILNAYNQATEEQKVLLENIFGKDMFHPKNIKERVKTFLKMQLQSSETINQAVY